ncbi:hypothetical protein [Streptomyces iconiensis]|uniref:HTH luxR-type domain-containing protein n=1 Tax=Streptomyces iconiensis TaxID=1384038 RepID=A0ABT6ZVP1_9ACTN|nr:hypothetical protein [Streptomyces iconiensis]MDJ1133140.1 hypothetical protein [Streptomyces iconiensis]
MLEELGLGPEEERVYRALVGRPGAVPGELAAGTPVRRTAELLAGLAERGLVTRVADGDTVRYTVVDPGLALMAELLGRHDRLRLAERAVAELAAQHESAGRGTGFAELVETVEGRAEIARRFGQLQLGARHSIDTFITADNRVVHHSENATEPVALERGVTMRAVIDAHFLRQPNGAASVELAVAQGAEIRVAASVPMKLLVTDRNVALVPVGAGHSETLLVHGALARLALALFESVWQRARPYRQPGDGLDPLDTRLLHLMLAGLTDEAVGRQLDLSTRSVQRRIRTLMDRAGVSTRAQLGWHARHRDWA